MPLSLRVCMSHVVSAQNVANVSSVSVKAGQHVSATEVVAPTGHVVHEGDPLVVIAGA